MINIHLAAFRNAPEKVFSDGLKQVREQIGDSWVMDQDKPVQMVWFLTGGSEKSVIERVKGSEFVVLVASQDGNSYAAASEVKSYLNNSNVRSLLIDYNSSAGQEGLKNFVKVWNVLSHLYGQRLGLLGEVSDWLVNSTVKPETILSVFGVEFVQILWDDLPNYKEQIKDGEFLKYFNKSTIDLEETAQVYTLISDLIQEKSLNAITVECFSLVNKHKVTACLPLALLNDKKIPAGCEGDLCSILAKMLVTEINASVPWMANLVSVKTKSVYFAHCTIPVSLTKEHSITTHYETGLGTAIKGIWDKNPVTIFRLNSTLSKAFLSKGNIVTNLSMPEACRTQIEVEMPENEIQKLKENPLGNHHIIIDGCIEQELRMFCQIKNIEII